MDTSFLESNGSVVGVLGFSAILVFLGIFLSFLTSKRNNDASIEEYANQPLQPWATSQDWRKGDSGVRLFNELRDELEGWETYLARARTAAVEFRIERELLVKTRSSLPEKWWFEWRRELKGFQRGRVEQARQRVEQLERLWVGDAHIEIEDRKDRIQKLNRERADLSEDQRTRRREIEEMIGSLERELRDLAEIVRRGHERTKVSPSATKLKEAREIHVNDVHHDITKTFLRALSQMEIYRERSKLIQQVTDDPSFTKDEKERLIATINELAASAEAKTQPGKQRRPGSIYGEGS